MKKKLLIGCGGLIGLFFLCSIVAALGGGNKPKTDTAQTQAQTQSQQATTQQSTKEPIATPIPKPTNTPTPIPSASDLLAKAAKDVYRDKVRSTNLDSNGLATIDYNLGATWDEYWAVDGFAMDLKTVIPKVFQIEGVKKVQITCYSEFTNALGKESVDIALKATMSAASNAKIEWKNILTANVNRTFVVSGETIYVHPALRKAWNEKQK